VSRAHEPSPLQQNTFSEMLPDAGDLTGATFSLSDSSCGASVGGPGYVNVSRARSSPGICQVQVTLSNGAIYSFSVTFGARGTGPCQGAFDVIDASSAVLIDPGRCQPPQDGAVGMPGDAGTATTGGTTGVDASNVFGPACADLRTASGVQPMRACGCGPTDPQLCHKPCGPEGRGTKSVTCTAAVYAETPICTFDLSSDYSCYRVPTAAENTSCPAVAPGEYVQPRQSSACTVDRCLVCNSFGGLPTGEYVDDRGAIKSGYCVCTPPDSTGSRTWTCAGDQDWPCPSGAGC
jgi:hypothetical protein